MRFPKSQITNHILQATARFASQARFAFRKVFKPLSLLADRPVHAKNIETVTKRPVSRAHFVKECLPEGIRTLEIGPLHAPICRRPFYNVQYLDVFSTAELKTKYQTDPNVDTAAIVNVDYVWRGESYSQLCGGKVFDAVVSSHNIEHVPCLVSHLMNVESCLAHGGALVLIIPDKRYCFDVFKSESSIEEVLDAYRDRRNRPSPSQLIRQELLYAHNDAMRHWRNDHGMPLYRREPDLFSRRASKQLDLFYKWQEEGQYIDTHSWIFTPGSFAEIVGLLNYDGLVTMEVDKLFPTDYGSHEFFAVLKKPLIAA